MKITELMKQLEEALATEGDVDVVVDIYEKGHGTAKAVTWTDCLPEGCYKGYKKAAFIIETGETVGTYH